jgi:hypothetical protein
LARAREKARVMRSTGEGGGLAIICYNRWKFVVEGEANLRSVCCLCSELGE